jgi:hypothetical protein
MYLCRLLMPCNFAMAGGGVGRDDGLFATIPRRASVAAATANARALRVSFRATRLLGSAPSFSCGRFDISEAEFSYGALVPRSLPEYVVLKKKDK